MTCELCGKPDPETVFLLPRGQSDGRLETIACADCALDSGYVCPVHDQIHLPFEDGSHDCPRCIEAELDCLSSGQLLQSFAALQQGLPPDEFKRLLNFGLFLRAVGVGDIVRSMLRPLVIFRRKHHSHHRQGSLQAVIATVIEAQTISDLLPQLWQSIGNADDQGLDQLMTDIRRCFEAEQRLRQAASQAEAAT